MSGRRSSLVLLPTLIVTWVAFAQVLSFQGLVVWVVLGSLATLGAVSFLATADRRLIAVLVGIALTALIPLLAKGLGGNTNGPIARSAFMACGVTFAMVMLVRTRYPLSALAASLLLLGGALGLGASGHAAWIVGAWAVAAAATMAMMGPYRREDLAERRRLGPFALILAGIGVVTILVIALVVPWLTDPWTMTTNSTVAVSTPTASPAPTPTPTAGASTSASVAPSVAPTARPTVPPTAKPVAAEEQSSIVTWLLRILSWLLLLALVLVLALIAWRAVVWLLWRRTRTRLSGGSAADQVVGAWTWVRLRRARFERPLPPNVSPDVAAATLIRGPDLAVGRVGRFAAAVAFNDEAQVDSADARAAWRWAQRASRRPRGATLRDRWRWSGRTPGVARRMLPSNRPEALPVAPEKPATALLPSAR